MMCDTAFSYIRNNVTYEYTYRYETQFLLYNATRYIIKTIKANLLFKVHVHLLRRRLEVLK